MSEVGQQSIKAMRDFVDVLKRGEALGSHFKITTRERPMTDIDLAKLYLPLEARLKKAGWWPSRVIRQRCPWDHPDKEEVVPLVCDIYGHSSFDRQIHTTDALNALRCAVEDGLVSRGYEVRHYDIGGCHRCRVGYTDPVDGREFLWDHLGPTIHQALVAAADKLLPEGE